MAMQEMSQEILFPANPGMEIPSREGALERLENGMTYLLAEHAKFFSSEDTWLASMGSRISAIEARIPITITTFVNPEDIAILPHYPAIAATWFGPPVVAVARHG